jgi:ribosomal protein S27AE
LSLEKRQIVGTCANCGADVFLGEDGEPYSECGCYTE